MTHHIKHVKLIFTHSNWPFICFKHSLPSYRHILLENIIPKKSKSLTFFIQLKGIKSKHKNKTSPIYMFIHICTPKYQNFEHKHFITSKGCHKCSNINNTTSMLNIKTTWHSYVHATYNWFKIIKSLLKRETDGVSFSQIRLTCSECPKSTGKIVTME